MNCNQQTSLKFLETQKQFLSVMFSCGWGIGTSTGSANDGSNDGRPSGSTTVNVVDKGSVKESNTHATIGKGNIEVADGSDIAGVNRDVNKTETVTRDEITGALDATVTVDNRIITGSFSEWWDNVYNKNAENYDERNEKQNIYLAADNVDANGNVQNTELSLLPTLGLTKSYVGEETYNLGTHEFSELYKKAYATKLDENNNVLEFRTPDQLSIKEKLFSTFDFNPLFQFASIALPSVNSDAKVYDVENEAVTSKDVLQRTIIPSFIGTNFSIIYGKVPSLINRKTSTSNVRDDNKGSK